MSSYATEGAPTPSAPAGEQEPEAAAPDTAPPDTAAPDTAAPDTAASDVAAPDQAAAEDTGPEDEVAFDEAGLDDAAFDEAGLDEAGLDGVLPDDVGLDDAVPEWRAPVSKLAIVALVTGVLALVPVAVGCGIAALTVIRRTGRRGHGMAVAALVATATWIIAAGAVGTVAVVTHGFKKPATIKYHEASVFKVRQGDCVNAPNGQAVSVLPCATPHDAEVFATFTLPGPAWPGTAAVQQEASSGCATRLSGYLNPQLSISLGQTYVFPNEVAWNAGTRMVVCEVHATSGQLTGSVRGGS
ncbi:MAG TPA: septum formation family protein [Trebonia sp.]